MCVWIGCVGCVVGEDCGEWCGEGWRGGGVGVMRVRGVVRRANVRRVFARRGDWCEMFVFDVG